MLETVVKICGAITAIAASGVVALRLYRWWCPVTAEISCMLVFDGSEPDSITVTLTNRSTSSVFIRSCSVRSTRSIAQLAWAHVKRPFLRPRLYPNLWYNGVVYELVGRDPLKLEAGQLIRLKKDILEHPLNAIYGPMIIANIRLTSGRVVRSKRMFSPPVWRLVGRRGSESLPNNSFKPNPLRGSA